MMKIYDKSHHEEHNKKYDKCSKYYHVYDYFYYHPNFRNSASLFLRVYFITLNDNSVIALRRCAFILL